MKHIYEYPDYFARFYDVIYHQLRSGTDTRYFLDNIWEHLEQGGTFIFDLFIPNPELLHKGIDKVMDFEGEYEPGNKLRRITSSYSDIVSQILDITMLFEWEENNQWWSREWKLKLRYFFRYELEHLLSLSKLNLVSIFGDYNEGSLNKKSKEFILVCRK